MRSLLSYYFFITALALLTLLFGATGLAAELPESFTVKRIHIEGIDFIKKKELLEVLVTRPPSPWRIWRKKPVASEEDISDDADRISQFYQSKGFYHAVVTYEVSILDEAADGDTPVQVAYHIEEGTPVSVESIVIDIPETQAPVSSESLLNAIPLKTGMRFEEKAYRESKQLILKRFGNVGYPLAEVVGKALIYPATDKAEVTFTVTPGQLCYFGATTVLEGKSVVKNKILTRSRTYLPGELYDTSKVEKSQRNLYNLDVFKAAVIQPGDPDPATGQVPMSLELKKKKKKTVKLGIGYGDEDGLRLKAGWTYRNPRDWAGKLKIEAKRTDLIQIASAGYNQPYFWDSRSALLTETGVIKERLDSYESRKLFGNVRFTRDINANLNIVLAYLLEYNSLEDLKLVNPEEQANFRDDHTFFISSVFSEIIHDTIDIDTNPGKGASISGAVEIASDYLGSELTYIRPAIEFKKYIELPFGTVLAGRVKLETIWDHEKDQGIPIFKRLFLGGANTVRGYAYQKIGALDVTGNPEGGRSAALANVELRRPIVGILSGVLFLDMGMLDKEEFHWDTKEIRYSAGAGLRIDTPVGPLRLDLGYKLNPPERVDDGAGEAFAADRWRLHFNIGHAF